MRPSVLRRRSRGRRLAHLKLKIALLYDRYSETLGIDPIVERLTPDATAVDLPFDPAAIDDLGISATPRPDDRLESVHDPSLGGGEDSDASDGSRPTP